MLNFKVINKNIRETKREILDLVCPIFNPMGLISPIIVKFSSNKSEEGDQGGTKNCQESLLIDQWNLSNNSVSKLSSTTVS